MAKWVNSSELMLRHCYVINEVKAPMILGKLQQRGVMLRPQDFELVLWGRKWMRRYLEGDLRHDESMEVGLLVELAQLYVSLHAKLEGTEDKVIVEPPKELLRREEPLNPAHYRERTHLEVQQTMSS